MNTNYQLVLDAELEKITASGQRPKLLLHCCCAPCSSYVLEYLTDYFDISALYYNPNTEPEEEYIKRGNELQKLVREAKYDIPVIIGEYENELFREAAKGLEACREGGERCTKCFMLRLRKTAELAKAKEFDYFSTTLTLSPHKNAELINGIGAQLSEEYSVAWLFSDFKKRGGYIRSIELSKQFDLYRQSYCGCEYGKL